MFFGQRVAEAVGAALHPFHVARLDAVFVLQQPAHVDGGGHAVFRHAAALALEVARMLDAFIGVDEEVAVAEHAGRERRDRDERRIALAQQGRVVRQRHLGGVEFAVLQHAPENLGGLQRQVDEVDAFRRERAVAQRLGAVIGPAREGQAQLGHERSLVEPDGVEGAGG